MKKTVIYLVIAAIAACGICSCSMTEMVSIEPAANAMWVGKSHADIIKAYGAPDREVSDGQKGVILVYENTTTTVNTYQTGPSYYGLYGFYYHVMDPFPNDVITEAETKTDYAHFYIDSHEKCYKVETNLEKEVPKHQKKK